MFWTLNNYKAAGEKERKKERKKERLKSTEKQKPVIKKKRPHLKPSGLKMGYNGWG